MRLRNIDFGRVLGASGIQGFFGEGYWFHKLWRPFGLNFDGMTFVAKTTTLEPRPGNMKIDDKNFSPTEFFPKCVRVKPFKGIALNSVGLSGPGAGALFSRGLWQKRGGPFIISFMSVGKSKGERLSELEQFVTLFRAELISSIAFWNLVGLHINFSCPNVGISSDHLVAEIGESLSHAEILGIPIMPKLSLEVSPEIAKDIISHQACDGLCISNTIPWGHLPEKIKWQKLFGTSTSPLAHLGGGGLSGKPLLPLLIEWLKKARKIGVNKPINAGGGILSLGDARKVLSAGASSISLGSIAILRPWRVRGIIRALQS